MDEENKVKVLTVEDLKKKLKEVGELKEKLQNQFIQVIGMEQLLTQQIEELSTK
jgi:hypothetical protein